MHRRVSSGAHPHETLRCTQTLRCKRVRRRRSARGGSSWRTCRRDVLGTSSMNSTSSGSCHLATLPPRKSRISCSRQLGALLEHDARQRPLAPLVVGDADDGGLLDLRVGHQLVLQLDRRDPLAARLDEVLGAVDEAHAAPLVDRGHVAGAQPAVVGEALARPRVVVVRRRDPVAAALQLAAGLAVARHGRRAAGLDDPALDAERRHARRRRAGRPAPPGAAAAGRRRGGAVEATGLVSVMPHACRIGTPSCSR